jgi:MFS transporter, CP family, cyanate transporter
VNSPSSGGITGTGRPLPYSLLLISVLLVAANLRAVIAAVGPVLPTIAHDTGMSPTALGVLVALPVAAFAVFSPVVHRLAARLGTERSVLFALGLLLCGTVVRSLPAVAGSLWPLFVGTVIVGAAIAVGNVLLPVIVRRDFPHRVPAVTGYYIAVQSVVAGAASGLAVPVSVATGSWRLAIGLWGILAVGAFVVWILRLRSQRQRSVHGECRTAFASASAASAAPVPVWRSVLAWQVAAYFGLQSTAFYVLLSWLPTVEQDMGVAAATAGMHLSVYLIVGIVANLAVSRFLTVRGDQRIAASAVPAWIVVAMLGMIYLPSLVLVWVTLSGLAVGASMVISLSLISLRGGGPRVTGRLSSMAQATAYAVVSVGLLGAGWIRQIAGPGQHLLVYVLVLAVLQVGLGFWVGRNRALEAGESARPLA